MKLKELLDIVRDNTWVNIVDYEVDSPRHMDETFWVENYKKGDKYLAQLIAPLHDREVEDITTDGAWVPDVGVDGDKAAGSDESVLRIGLRQ